MMGQWQNVAWSAPPVWKGETFTILGCGPSLNIDDVMTCSEITRVIAINSSFRMAPFADVLYAGDGHFWDQYPDAMNFTGIRVGMAYDMHAGKYYPNIQDKDPAMIKMMGCSGETGLELYDRRALRMGRNGGFQAINLAVHLGAKRIILLGYDMQLVDGVNHWPGAEPRGKHQPPEPFDLFIPAFDTMVDDLAAQNIEVINCTPGSALETFPVMPIHEVM